MSERTNAAGCPSSPRQSKPTTATPPAPLPDLFGFVSPASPTTPTTKPGPAEWPAGGRRPVPAFAAPDRPLETAPRRPSDWAGIYARSGRTLRRADGATVQLGDTQKDRLGATDAARIVRLGYPGGGQPVFSSGLYDRRQKGETHPPLDDLSGYAWQDRETGRWYRFAYVAPGSYRVEPTTGRRRGRARS